MVIAKTASRNVAFNKVSKMGESLHAAHPVVLTCETPELFSFLDDEEVLEDLVYNADINDMFFISGATCCIRLLCLIQ